DSKTANSLATTQRLGFTATACFESWKMRSGTSGSAAIMAFIGSTKMSLMTSPQVAEARSLQSLTASRTGCLTSNVMADGHRQVSKRGMVNFGFAVIDPGKVTINSKPPPV